MNLSASKVFQTVTGIVPFPSTYLLVSDHEGGNDADIFANLKEANIKLYATLKVGNAKQTNHSTKG